MTRQTTARPAILALAAALALAACKVDPGGLLSVTTTGASGKGAKASPSPASKAAGKAGAASTAQGAVMTGVVRAPSALIGNDAGSLIGNDAGSLIGNDAGSYQLQALDQRPFAGVKVVLADAAGTPLPGVPEVETDVMGRFTFPGKVPGGVVYQVMATYTTPKGGKGTLRTLAQAGPTPAEVGVGSTLVAVATLDGAKGAIGNLSLVAFAKAAAAADADLDAASLPDFADAAAVKAFAQSLVKRLAAVEAEVNRMRGELATFKSDFEALKADLAALAARDAGPEPPPMATIAQEIAVGAAPRTLAFDAAGTLWVVNYKDASVTRIAADGTKQDVAVGESPLGLAIAPDGDVWVASYGKGTVHRLNADGTVEREYPIGASPFGVAVAKDGSVWATNYKDKTVSRLDPATGALTTFPTGARPFGIALDAQGRAWVTNNAGHSVTRLAEAAGQPGASFPTDRTPHHLAFDAAGTAWVTATGSDRLTHLDAQGTAIGSFETGGEAPWGLAAAPNGEVWVTNTAEPEPGMAKRNDAQGVARFASDGRRLGLWRLEGTPQGVAIDGQGRPWVALKDTNKVVRLAP